MKRLDPAQIPEDLPDPRIYDEDYIEYFQYDHVPVVPPSTLHRLKMPLVVLRRHQIRHYYFAWTPMEIRWTPIPQFPSRRMSRDQWSPQLWQAVGRTLRNAPAPNSEYQMDIRPMTYQGVNVELFSLPTPDVHVIYGWALHSIT